MTKDKLKPLIKLILKEIQEHNSTKLVDSWKQISTVQRGRMTGTRGYFIMKNGKLADASFEMDGSDGFGGGVDHYGYALALGNKQMFGIPDELEDDDNQDNYLLIWKYIEKAILARVCTMVKASNTGRPNITVQIFNHIPPKSALRLVQGWVGTKIPDAPEDSTVTIEIGHNDKYISANNIREFLSAEDPRQLRIG